MMTLFDRLLLGAILIVAVLWVVGIALIMVDFDALVTMFRNLLRSAHFRVLA